MNPYRLSFILFACVFGASSALADEDYDQCKAALGVCEQRFLVRSEKSLKVAWDQALSGVGGLKARNGALIQAEQNAWLAFRAKACLYHKVLRDKQRCIAKLNDQRSNYLTDFYVEFGDYPG